jgi:hypothetical protein
MEQEGQKIRQNGNKTEIKKKSRQNVKKEIQERERKRKKHRNYKGNKTQKQRIMKDLISN